jgi:hypothetical protein
LEPFLPYELFFPAEVVLWIEVCAAAACVPEDGLAADDLDGDDLVEDDLVLAAEEVGVWVGFVAVVDAFVCASATPDMAKQTSPQRPARHHRIVSARYIVDLNSNP